MYISVYQKTAYRHAEEGGYYQEGRHLLYYNKVKHGKAKKEMQKIFANRDREYESKFWANEFDSDWRWGISYDGRAIDVSNGYIGDGCYICIESKRKLGSHEIGYQYYE